MSSDKYTWDDGVDDEETEFVPPHFEPPNEDEIVPKLKELDARCRAVVKKRSTLKELSELVKEAEAFYDEFKKKYPLDVDHPRDKYRSVVTNLSGYRFPSGLHISDLLARIWYVRNQIRDAAIEWALATDSNFTEYLGNSGTYFSDDLLDVEYFYMYSRFDFTRYREALYEEYKQKKEEWESGKSNGWKGSLLPLNDLLSTYLLPFLIRGSYQLSRIPFIVIAIAVAFLCLSFKNFLISLSLPCYFAYYTCFRVVKGYP